MRARILRKSLISTIVDSVTVTAIKSVIFLQLGSLEVIKFLICYNIYCVLYCVQTLEILSFNFLRKLKTMSNRLILLTLQSWKHRFLHFK